MEQGYAVASPSIGLVGALVTDSDGQVKALHISLPDLPLRDRKGRRWVRQRINEQAAAAPGVPIVFHRLTKRGVTNTRGWLAWL